jgi:hypothetical protein
MAQYETKWKPLSRENDHHPDIKLLAPSREQGVSALMHVPQIMKPYVLYTYAHMSVK